MMPEITYYVALPFLGTPDGLVGGEAAELPSPSSAISKARSMSANPQHVGALAFARSGDPSVGEFADAKVLAQFGTVPSDLSEL